MNLKIWKLPLFHPFLFYVIFLLNLGIRWNGGCHKKNLICLVVCSCSQIKQSFQIVNIPDFQEESLSSTTEVSCFCLTGSLCLFKRCMVMGYIGCWIHKLNNATTLYSWLELVSPHSLKERCNCCLMLWMTSPCRRGEKKDYGQIVYFHFCMLTGRFFSQVFQ